MINSQLIVHNSDEIMNENILEFDCLYYRVSEEKLAYQELSNVINDVIPYCFRPTNTSKILFRSFVNIYDQNLTFEELYLSNISAKDLLFWSAPIDLVESYEIYLHQMDFSLSNELFYNCTKPWFGLECQYSFEFSEEMSINNVVENEFSIKKSSSNILNRLTCYIHLKCNRGSEYFCLDWREICNGRIDCIDEGLDEAYCFDMELNECEENEYRCHNGLCIPEEFWENGYGEADCLDRSDEFNNVLYLNNCYRDPRFRCEEHSCRTNWHHFPCGDGQCVQTFDKCHNGRDQLLIQSIFSNQGNISNKCWIAMICLTKLIPEYHENKCEQILMNNSIFEFIKSCHYLFEFPLIPINSGHIRFLYENISFKSNINQLIIPDYICYNDQLCNDRIPNFYYQNLSCLHSEKFDLISSVTGHRWIDMILSIDSYFRSCLIHLNQIIKSEMNLESLYQCKNSSKLISKDRILDENIDCYFGDDEDYELSCLINMRHRIKCLNEKKCLSSLHTIDDCSLNEHEYEKKLSFQMICNGLNEIFFKDLNNQIHTDESQCNYWPCNNIYTRCDGYWTCPNGEDEQNCSKNLCEKSFSPCISLLNNSFICLSSKYINNGINDCLGGTDELHFCRTVYPSENNPKRFHCQNSDLCLSSAELSNNIPSCPQGDDEKFCQNQQFLCETNRTILEDVLCYLFENEKNRIIHFSINTLINYPEIKQIQFNQTNEWKSNEDNHLIKYLNIKKSSSLSVWYCNRGLAVRLRSNNQIKCMCPPSYYGDLCEYQNERVSLTLGLVRAERDDVYIIILMLINQNENIESYDQFEYIASQTCGIKFNRYLLYPNRPKNLLKNYTIRINIYEKHQMIYRGSWHLLIPFRFLPVNRISALLYIPYEQSFISSECLNQCENGQCMKYLNTNERFCHCYPGWSGIQCNILINCQNCSSDSLCIGLINNKSICICPLMKYGKRCYIQSSCPDNACLNNGQCIPSDKSLTNNDYYCICSNEYYGKQCQHFKSKLQIFIENLNIPSYILAYFLTISNKSEPKLTIMLEKLTLFQRVVTYRISIPYHIVILQLDNKYYLGVVQFYSNIDVSTEINPSRECIPIKMLFNSTIMKMSQFERIKYSHILCQKFVQLNCFIDEYYICLCTKDHHANCLEFNRNNNLQCLAKYSCLNGGKCFQDHPYCPSSIICVCTDCFFGSKCQFYAKGLGLTLDEILGYEIKPSIKFLKQPFSVQLSFLLTMLMFLIGIINSFFSILTFKNKTCQEVGCGIYLLVSSIVSLCIVILFTLKFWFLIYSYENISNKNLIIYLNCMLIEPLLKLFLYIDNWLNSCVAGERAFSVFKGILFNKNQSKLIAKWIICLVFLINLFLFIPQLINLNLYYDKKEDRTWCVVYYSSLLNSYSSFIQFFHFFSPFLLNLFSSVFLIIGTTRQKLVIDHQNQFGNHFKTKLNQHKHLLISPIILIILSLPRLIISLTLNCQKSSKYFWLYLLGYFISFMPSVMILFVFILPSPTYKKQFQVILTQTNLNLKKLF